MPQVSRFWIRKRRQAEELFAQGLTTLEVAAKLDLGHSTTYKWRKEWVKRTNAGDRAHCTAARPYPGARNLYGW